MLQHRACRTLALPHTEPCPCRAFFKPIRGLRIDANHFRCLPICTTVHEDLLHPLRGQRKAAEVSCTAGVQRRASFPAGRGQARVQLPALFILTYVADVQPMAEAISAAVSAGATGVILVNENDAGGADLYEAGVTLKELIRGRAVLLVADRIDIVDAIEADGVALTSKGVPTVVARRMLRASNSLIAIIAGTAAEARTAAAEGANLVILQGPDGTSSSEAIQAAKAQQSSGSIPVIPAIASCGEASSASAAGADGAVLDVRSLLERDTASQVKRALLALQGEQEERPATERGTGLRQPAGEGLKHFLDASKEALLESERVFLSKSLDFLKEAAPEMEELGLLRDAIKQLDELFLLVVVGEFNSGKSSIINALLGGKYLAEGILPTTNEISVLKFSGNGREEAVQDVDGLYIRKLPAELLRDINIVDTPGTNVIVDRQQRLTEEYVPRADLVLFCMSAGSNNKAAHVDRPFTESETTFLKYIRQWGKKVVFIVNKVDILSNDGEVNEVTRFVADNATRLLGVERTQVLPVSARAALEAKLAVSGGGNMAGGILSSTDEKALEGNAAWEASRFGTLERFILDFLVGGKSAGETVRLKLQTPLFVADALLDAAGQQLAEDLAAAEQDVQAVQSVQGQLDSFRQEMERDGQAQRIECRKLVSGAIKRAQTLVDSTLQLSNLDALSGYIFGSKSDPRRLPVAAAFQQEVVGPAARQLEELVEDHSSWLQSNCERQLNNYRNFAEARAQQLGTPLEEITDGASTSGSASDPAEAAAEDRRKWRESRAASQEGASDSSEHSQTSMAIVKAFDPGAGAVILEEEIRESVINTAGAALGAGVLGVVSTFVLPNTLEDLLAVAVGGLVGYAALLNLPLRRSDAKEKLQRVASNFVEEVESKLEDELMQSLNKCIVDVNSFMLPLQNRMEAVVARIQGLQQRQAAIQEELQQLQQRAANVE